MAMTLKSKPNHPNGKRFAAIEQIKENRNKSYWRYQEAFRGLEKKRWYNCIISVEGVGVCYL